MTEELKQKAKDFIDRINKESGGNWLDKYYLTDLLVMFATENGIAELEKENAELKEEFKKWKDEWQEQVQKATDEGYARTLQIIQLSKAKEIMQKLIANAPDTYSGTNIELQQKKMFTFQDAVNKAEQFLKRN